MFERREMGQSDRLWSLIAVPSSWFAVAAAQVGMRGTVEWGLAVAAAGFVVSFLPLLPVFVAIWSGRVNQTAATLAGRPMAVGLVGPMLVAGLFDGRVVAFVAFQVSVVGAVQLVGVLIRLRRFVLDTFATVVGSATAVAGFWLGWWNDVSPIGISVLFFVYGFGVSTAAFTWIENLSNDQAAC